VIVIARERVLRRIALGDSRLLLGAADPDGEVRPDALDERTRSLVRLGALLAADPPGPPLKQSVDDALTASVTMDEIVLVLVSLIPTIGMARAAAVAPKLGLAIGYDVDAALEAPG
jgi:alkylhydroperoxidase/carboxymuconolactone decarboxylase family protein YurZ